jgi:hypothetical protein
MNGLYWLTIDSTVRILYLQCRRFALYKTGTVLCPGNSALWTQDNHQQNQELLKIRIFNRDIKSVFYEAPAAFLKITNKYQAPDRQITDTHYVYDY